MKHPADTHHPADPPEPSAAPQTQHAPQAASPVTTPGAYVRMRLVNRSSDLDNWVEVLKELSRQASR